MHQRFSIILRTTVTTSLLALVMAAHVSAALAELTATGRMQRLRKITTARYDYLQARLDFQLWVLHNLQELDKQGLSTPLEVKRAKVLTTSLQARRQSVRQLADFLDALAERQDRRAVENMARDTVPTIRVHLPGSAQLVGWLEADRAPRMYRTHYFTQLHAQRQQLAQAATGLLNTTRAHLEFHQRHVEKLNQLSADQRAAGELRRAELRLAVARAEHRLVEAVEQHQQLELKQLNRRSKTEQWTRQAANPPHHAQSTPHPPESQTMLTSHSEPGATFIDSRSHDRLHELALRVAAAEARAEGELQAAKIALQQRQLRVDALRKLNTDGLASPAEVDTAERQHVSARQRLDRIRDQQRRHQQNLLATKPSVKQKALLANTRFVNAVRQDKLPGGRNGHDLLNTLPASLTHNQAVFTYLTELYWQLCELNASGQAVAAACEMHQGIYRKLNKMAGDGLAHPRELQLALLDLQFHQAQLQAVAERREILLLEQQRFVCQLQQQIRPLDDQGRMTLLAYAEPSALQILQKAAVAGDVPATFNWHAALEVDQPFAQLVEPEQVPLPAMRRRRTARLPVAGILFAPDKFSLDPPTLATLARLPPHPTPHLLDSAQRECAGDGLFVPRSLFHESYFRCYAFGIRRIYVDGKRVWHSRTNSHGAPWYIPGAPTNYR